VLFNNTFRCYLIVLCIFRFFLSSAKRQKKLIFIYYIQLAALLQWLEIFGQKISGSLNKTGNLNWPLVKLRNVLLPDE